MHALRVLIIEDDILLSTELEEQLLDFGYSIIDTVSNSTDAVLAFRRRLPDLVICDINLEGSAEDGIDIALQFNEISKVPIIFLTAFGDAKTVTRARAAHPAYYLIKPCNPTQLKCAIDFALHNFSKKEEAITKHSLKHQTPPSSELYTNPDNFFVKKGNRYLRIEAKDILWVEALGSNVKIVTDKANFTLAANLSSFEKQVTHAFLVRVHRSYLVNLHQVSSFLGGSAFILCQGKENEIPVGKTYRSSFQDLFYKLSSD